MSSPSKRIWPELGASSPVSCPISVVLPAPLGPMMACSSPRRMSSVMWSEAVTPPKRLVRSAICNRASGTAPSRQQTVDAAAREQDDEQQQRAEDDLPVFGHAGERLLQHQQRHRADQRAEGGR